MDISSIREKINLPMGSRIISCSTNQRGQKLHLRITVPVGKTNTGDFGKQMAQQLNDLGYKSVIHFHRCSEECDLQTVKTIINTVPNPNSVQDISNHPEKGVIFSYQNLYHFKEADALLLRELSNKITGEIIINDKTTGKKIDKTRYLQLLKDNRSLDRNIKVARSIVAAKIKPVIVQQGNKREQLIIQFPRDSQFDLDALRQKILETTGMFAVFEPVEPSFITTRRRTGIKRPPTDRYKLQELMHQQFSDVLAIEKIRINKKTELVEIISWTRRRIDIQIIEQKIREFFDEQNYANYVPKIIIKGNLPAPEYVADSKQLELAVEQILEHDVVSVDIEADGRFSYVEKLCLVQLATVNRAYIIDVLTIDDISLLSKIFDNRIIQKVFHDGRWDIELIKRDLHMNVLNIFDTSAAYRVIGNIHHTSLDKLIEKFFKVPLDKKLQKANWGKRPLTDEMLIYAQLDVHFLIKLKEFLLSEIISMDRLHLIEDYGHFLETVEPFEAEFNPNSFWRVKGSQKLSPQQQAVLKELYLWRENIAKARNKPPYMIFNSDLLIEISRNCPDNKEKLLNIYNVKEFVVQKYGKKIISCVKKGLESAPPVFPEDNVIKRYPHVKNESLKVNKFIFVKVSEWRKKTALKLSTDPEIILPKDSVHKLAFLVEKGQIRPFSGFGEEKIKRYGKDLKKLHAN